MNKNIYIIIFLLAITVISSIVYKINKNGHVERIGSYDGVCAFDLDGTITCGLENAKKAIETCRNYNYKIAINTARPIKFYSDIKLDKLGLNKEEFIDDFYYGEVYLCSFTDYNCMTENISDTKVKHLNTLADKWNVKPKNIILFDDQIYNINKAKANGFSVITANNPICGLPDDVTEQIKNIITLGNDNTNISK